MFLRLFIADIKVTIRYLSSLTLLTLNVGHKDGSWTQRWFIDTKMFKRLENALQANILLYTHKIISEISNSIFRIVNSP